MKTETGIPGVTGSQPEILRPIYHIVPKQDRSFKNKSGKVQKSSQPVQIKRKLH